VRALLDVNVLIALLDSAHIHHQLAHAWMSEHSRKGWASTPVTLNGCIRILAQPKYPGGPLPMREIVMKLKNAAQKDHQFWPDEVNALSVSAFSWEHILGHRQFTDAHLLAIAVSNNGRLVTFDRRISHQVIKGAKATNLHFIE
jgi:uncharacterized protein